MTTIWQEALDTLYGLANWETRPPGARHDFGLERIRGLLEALGDPQAAWPAVHVAGTNGKGSTCAMLASALVAAGYRVGLYTSPHLHTVRERVQVDGELISEAAVIAWLDAHRGLLEATPGLTTFEALTALAFSHFRDAGVDVAVVEVGLGGRLDTTNVVLPVVSVLTAIGLDHTEVLGPTLAAIALDKCGILRPGVAVVSAPQEDEAGAVVEAEAVRVGAPLTRVGRDVRWHARPTADGERLAVEVGGDDGPRLFDLALGLAGPHQHENAATAVGALVRLAERGWALDRRAVERGLAEARWPARFERFGDGPVLVIDGAHNPHGAAALVRALAAHHPGARRHLVVGASYGKDVEGILAALLPAVTTVVATRADHPKAMPASEVAETAGALGYAVRVADSPSQALELALGAAEPSDVVVAAGSIFVAADVREAWLARAGLPLPPRDPPIPADQLPSGDSATTETHAPG